MTLAETSFIFNGTSSLDFGIFIVRNGVHFIKKTRERLVTIATRPGQYNYGPYIDSLSINFTCGILDTSRSALISHLSDLETLLDPTMGDKPLVVSDRPGTWYAHFSGSLDLSPLSSAIEFTLPFLAPDPAVH